MERFVKKHQAQITGTISCFDRILFKGHLPLGWADAMEGFISRQGLRIKDFGRFVSRHSEQIKQHARAMAEQAQRPYIHLDGPARKENIAQSIAHRDRITDGLVCILAAVEACHSFKLAYGKGKPRLVSARRKCLCLYFYFVDREFGFLHVRITSWFPFMIQVCLNGHDWLARKLDRHGIAKWITLSFPSTIPGEPSAWRTGSSARTGLACCPRSPAGSTHSCAVCCGAWTTTGSPNRPSTPPT